MWNNRLANHIVLIFVSCVLIPVNSVFPEEPSSPVIISEFMAVNTTTLLDGDGAYSDWIEIYNAGTEAVNLNSWYLTDDLSDLTKWQFPDTDTIDLTLSPGAYLLVFASEDESSESPYLDKKSYIHTSFKLREDGENLALIYFDGQTIIHCFENYPRQFSDISYGTGVIGATPGYFTKPTPESSNSDLYAGSVKDTKFSVDRGFFSEAFDLEITTSTEGAVIHYTLDGTEPSTENGTVYSAPIPIEKTMVLRAAAFKDGYIPSNIDTQTYLFISDVILQSPNGEAPDANWPSPGTQSSTTNPGGGGRPGGGGGGFGGSSQVLDYGMDPDVVNDSRYADVMDDALLAIPSLSIVTDLKNLFDSSTGIYTHAQQDGQEWERPISLELIDPQGSKGFQVNAGLRIRGGVSRSGSNPKHNFRVLFRSQYEDAKLNYPLFEEEGVEEYDKVDLRTGQNFSWSYSSGDDATWLYDVFTRDTEGAMGKPYTRSRFYHLYINGHYWGLYQTEERPEASFGASYLGGHSEDYDTIKADNDNGSIYAVDGNLTAYQALWTEINNGVASNEDYFRLQGLAADGSSRVPDYPNYLDVDSLIDYMLVIYYTGDRDCPLGPPGSDNRPRNLYGIFNRENPGGFQFITHDNEWSLLAGQSTGMGRTSGSGVNVNRVNASLGSSLRQKTYFNPWWLHNELMSDSSEYRLRFADRVYKHLFNDGALTADRCAKRFESRKNEIDMAIIAESARWGDYQSSRKPRTKDDDWLPAVEKNLNNFILASPSNRTDILLSQIKAKGWYPTIAPPAINQHGGEIDAGFTLSITAATGEIHYTLDGSDPRLPGGAVNPNGKVYSNAAIPLNRSTHVMARAYLDGEWSPLADAAFKMAGSIRQDLRITEIHYHPAPPSENEIAAGFDDGDDFEFIVLYNANNNQTLDLSDVHFTDGIDFTFDADEIPFLDPTDSILLVSNQAAFEYRYGDGYPIYGEYDGRFNNGGEKITLVDSEGNIILDFEYDDAAPWPEEPDGNGPSLQIIDIYGDYNDPANWKAGEATNGTPVLDGEFPTQVDYWMLHR